LRRCPTHSSSAGGGADLLVDCLCYTASHARMLLPLARQAGSTVMISAKAVYSMPPATTPTRRPHRASTAPSPRHSRPCHRPARTPTAGPGRLRGEQGAAERILLDSGAPVTVLRPEKVHGEGAATPREWVFVKRALDRRPAVFLARRGRGVDQSTAAANLAALIEVVAAAPGRRILNSADPDARARWRSHVRSPACWITSGTRSCSTALLIVLIVLIVPARATMPTGPTRPTRPTGRSAATPGTCRTRS
jgi:hypothetical protein